MGCVEMDIVGSDRLLMTFSKLGRFVIFGIVQGEVGTWKGTKVHGTRGVLPHRKIVLPSNILKFLCERAEHVKEAFEGISDRQYDKIADITEKNITSALHTDGVKALAADASMFGPEAVLREREQPRRAIFRGKSRATD
jgi:hypothetical protein